VAQSYIKWHKSACVCATMRIFAQMIYFTSEALRAYALVVGHLTADFCSRFCSRLLAIRKQESPDEHGTLTARISVGAI